MRCKNCRKIFTITKHKGKVGLALCPYCLTQNTNKNAKTTNKQRPTSKSSTIYG